VRAVAGPISNSAPRAGRPGRPPRREQVKADIREIFLELLAESSFHDLTVDEIARRAGLTRSAFYFYFADRQELLATVTEEVGDQLYREADRWWHGKGEPEVLVRTALEAVVGVYGQHARVLRVATEVSGYDEGFRQVWRALVERFVRATAEHLHREQQAGRVTHLTPREAAESLVWMTERSCYIYLGSQERTAADLVESLTAVWIAALYPQVG
jgi:AcrR family transcriptional regulator